MVAALRLLRPLENLLHLGFVLRDDAVDALEHLVLLVATVVRSRDLHELHDANLLRVLDVGSAAHLDVVADRVGGDGDAVRNDVREALELILLAREKLLRLIGRNLLADKRLVQRDETRDFGLNLREVLRRNAVREVKVVIEPLVRRRSDVHLDVLEQIHNRPRHHVGGRMPSHFNSHFCHNTLLLKDVYYSTFPPFPQSSTSTTLIPGFQG